MKKLTVNITIIVLGLILIIGSGGGGEDTNKAPIVEAGVDQTVIVNAPITITGSATDSDGMIVSYEWKCGNDILATTATFEYIPTVLGINTLIFTATDDDGESSSDSVNIEVKESIESPDFLIITPQEFVTALAPLIEHKNKIAMPTTLLTLEFIKENYMGKDMPEKIKRAIVDYQEEYKIAYVMLVGDSDKFPIRYIRAINTEWDTRYYPSDLYYADLYDKYGNFDDWDSDNDGFYGTTDFSGQGEGENNSVNVDKINLKPDVSVARVPASTEQEVTNYVNKIIQYEFNAWKSDWRKEALIISDYEDFDHEEDATKAVNSLTNFSVNKFFWSAEEPYQSMEYTERVTEIANFINQGLGYIRHGGHGDPWSMTGGFAISDMNQLTNTQKLPIIFTNACLTADFHFGYAWQVGWQNAEEQYLTVDGKDFDGRKIYKAIRPMPADIQPAKYDYNSLMEAFLVQHEEGAIAYMGSVAKSEHGGKHLQQYFTENLNSFVNYSSTTLGSLWINSMYTFMENEAYSGMGDYYAYLSQHKVMLFGDPSLRINGVSRIQKEHFLGEWEMVHDGWKGTLSLIAIADDPIDLRYNIKGQYTDAEGNVKDVIANVQTPNYPQVNDWQDNQMTLRIDFNENFDFSDEQLFTLYLFTQSQDEMAGVTQWNNNPFGVSLYKKGAVSFNGIHDGINITPEHIKGTYEINHDGWRGTITLDYQEDTSIDGQYISSDGKTHKVYGNYDETLPYIITLFIDFNDTVNDSDDSKFELYLFTQTKDGMAGITYWNERPFGVRLTKTSL